MKIGILSINAHTKVLNFASPLHTYAFWSFLKEHGIESTIIDYKPVYYQDFDARHPLDYYKEHPKDDAKLQKSLLEKWERLYQEREIRFDRFEEFIETYYHKTNQCYTAKLLQTEDPGFDCYICATDVIWKCGPKGNFDKGFLLKRRQLKGKKKIAYAASRGASEYSSEQAKIFFNSISDIDYLSVREKSLKEYIQKHSELPVAHVLDPVFLREKDFYYNLAVSPKEKGYVLIYTVMAEARPLVEMAVAFAAARNLKVIELSENFQNANVPDGTYHPVLYGLGIEEWLGYMKDAEYIFTNSFHACCFSIIFGKQFFAGKRRVDKIGSLLDMFHLANRRVDENELDKALRMPDTDFKEAESLRLQYVEESSSFLLNAIRDLEHSDHKNHKNLVHEDVFTKNESAPDQKSGAQEGRLKKMLRRLYK